MKRRFTRCRTEIQGETEGTLECRVNRFRHEITKQMEDFQAFLEKEYQTVSEEVPKLKQRNHLAILGDRAISQADRQALNELISAAKKSETNDTKTAANAEIARIVSYWVYMSRTETMSISAQFPDRTSKKDDEIPTNRLIADIQEHPEWSVRAVVARLLKQRKEKGVPEILLKTALTDNNLEVVKHAVISFRAVTEAKVWGFFDFDGLEQWWKEHSAEVNERLRPLQGQ
jgi:hypothetical protein